MILSIELKIIIISLKYLTATGLGGSIQLTAKTFYYGVLDGPVNFRFIFGGISAEKFFWKIFISPKDSYLNFRESLLNNC